MTVALVRRLALWTVLVILVLLTIHGFAVNKLFAQEIWIRSGLERFLVFAAAYALCFTVFSIVWPDLFLPSVIAFVALYSAVAAGPLAVAGVALLVLSSLVLGDWILRSGTNAILSMLLGLSVYMFLVSLAALTPVNYWIVYLVVLAAPLVWRHRSTVTLVQRSVSLLGSFTPKSAHERLALGSLVFVLLAHWLVSLQPEVSADGLAMHLVVPSSVAMFHRWSFDAGAHLWAVMPMGGDWCYTIVYMFGGEPAARLLNFAFLAAIAGLLASRTSFFIAALFAATPLVQLVTGSLFVENLWALLALGAVISLSLYREKRRPSYFYLAFILAGSAAATKFGAILFLFPLAVLAMLTARPRPRHLFAALGCFVILAAPPYLTAFVKTGNPVFPFLSSTASIEDQRFKAPLSFLTPYDMTFHTSRYIEGQDGAAGFQYFLLLPLAFLLLGRNSTYLAWAAAAALIIFVPLTITVSSNLRYLYPALPLAMLFSASALPLMKAADVALYRSVMTLLVLLFCLDIYFLPSSGWYHKDFALNPASSRGRAAYVQALAPVRNLVAYLNAAHSGEAVAFFGSNAIAGLRGPAFTDTWHTPAFNARVASLQSAEDCRRLMRDYQTTLMVAPVPDSNIGVEMVPVEAFLRNCTETERRSGAFYVARLRPSGDCRSDQLRAPLAPGKYDDVDRNIVYRGAWKRGHFAGGSQNTLTYTKQPGASFLVAFDGAEVNYVYSKAFNRGTAEVFIDGVSRGRIDLYSSAIRWQSSAQFQCARGPHVLEIRNTGPAFIDLDAIEVR